MQKTPVIAVEIVAQYVKDVRSSPAMDSFRGAQTQVIFMVESDTLLVWSPFLIKLCLGLLNQVDI